jgi:hypothetical protein
MLHLISQPCVSRHPSFANYLTVELTVLQEMSRELAELFGLTLPIPFKRQASQTAGYRLATAQPGGSLDLLPERDDISVW